MLQKGHFKQLIVLYYFSISVDAVSIIFTEILLLYKKKHTNCRSIIIKQG